jgi:ubiquinone/menaquinone biosynthesis C-methylase UbiE
MKKTIFDHFGAIAPFYERLFPVRDYSEFIALVDAPTAGMLLDAGGGTGRIGKLFVKQSRQVVVADVSLGMLHVAVDQNQLTAACCEAESLPFPDQSFDRIIMVDAYHHVRNQELTIKEFIRLVKPGGRIIIEEPDIANFGVILIAAAEKMMLMRSHFRRAETICSFFEGSPGKIRIERKGINYCLIYES